MSTVLAKRPKTALSRYSPDKGLKTIAVAEAAEKHYARAKDATKLQQAIRLKLEAQAEFVLWWDTAVEKNKGGGDVRNTRRRSATGVLTAGRDGIPDRYVIDRWRRKLNDPETFEATYTAALARYVKILEFESIDAQLKASLSNEWETPTRYVEAVRRVLGAIDLDPASTTQANRRVQAKQFFTIQEDGLTQPWQGRVFLNPPYGGLSGPFAGRLIEHVRAGTVTAAVLLINANSTDAAWFQPLWDYLLCFTDHRIAFISSRGGEGGSTHGSCFVYFGSDRIRFLEIFSPFGAIIERAHG